MTLATHVCIMPEGREWLLLVILVTHTKVTAHYPHEVGPVETIEMRKAGQEREGRY